MIRPDRKGNLRSSGIVGLSDQEDTPVVFTHTVGMKQQQSSYTSWTTKEKWKGTKVQTLGKLLMRGTLIDGLEYATTRGLPLVAHGESDKASYSSR